MSGPLRHRHERSGFMIRYYLDLIDHTFERLDTSWATIDLENPLLWKKMKDNTWDVCEVPQDTKLMNFQRNYNDYEAHPLTRLWAKDADAKIADDPSEDATNNEASTSKGNTSSRNKRKGSDVSNNPRSRTRARQDSPSPMSPESQDEVVPQGGRGGGGKGKGRAAAPVEDDDKDEEASSESSDSDAEGDQDD